MPPITMSPQMRKSLATIIDLISGFSRRDRSGDSPRPAGRPAPASRHYRNATRCI